MRRWRHVAAVAALATLALAGCGGPAGTDGDLTDDWRPVGTVEQFTPEVGECHLIGDPTSYLTSHQPVDCARPHLVETFHLGRFTGELGARPSPPKVGSTALRPAYAECDAQARRFVGGDWHGARLGVQVAPPSPGGWAGGSRWFRCDIFEVSSVDAGANNLTDVPSQRAGSLRDALKGTSPLAYGCQNESRAGILLQVPCTAAHRFEYVGTWTAPDVPYDDVDRDEDQIHSRCRRVIAGYVKVPVDRLLPYRSGTLYVLPSEEAWNGGDREIRCFLWSSDRALKRSVKGGGTKALPVR